MEGNRTNVNIKRSTRCTYIDAAKGVGILTTMFVHSSGIPIIGSYLCGLYLPVFWVIMGYFTPQITKDNLQIIIKKRFRELMFPYVVSNFILIPLNWMKLYLGGGYANIWINY